MGAISSLFGYVLNWLYEFFNNFGLAIIVFSVLLRIILLPITIKQQKSMEKNAEMQGKLKEIQNKYKNNPEKLNKETMELYKREKMSPFSGCLSSILQIVIILAVFYMVSRPLTYMRKVEPELIDKYVNEITEEGNNKTAYTEIAVINQKGSKDEKVNINMDFLGIDLSKVPNTNLKDYKVYIIPVLYVITSFISIRLTTKMQTKGKEKKSSVIEGELVTEEGNLIEKKEDKDESLETMQDMTKGMSYMMPLMSIFIAFIAPLGLALYWLVSNVLMIVERLIINLIFNKKEEN